MTEVTAEKMPPTIEVMTEKAMDKTGMRNSAKKTTAKILTEEEDIVN